MRIEVIFDAEDKKFPMGYRMMITSVIKKSLELADEEYFRDLYYYEEKKNKRIKPFVSSVFLRRYEIQNDEFILNDSGSIIISTPDYNFGITLYNGFLKLKSHQYRDYKITINRVILKKENVVNEEKILCRTLSPVVITDKNKKPVSIEDIDKFNEELNYIADLSLETYRGYKLKRNIAFTPVRMKKIVAKEKITDFKNISSKDYIYIEAYSGQFYLEGDIEDLRLLMQLGIGFRRSECFGLIDLV